MTATPRALLSRGFAIVGAAALVCSLIAGHSHASAVPLAPASSTATTGSWSAVGGEFNDTVNALLRTDTILYAGGDFTSAGGVTAARIAAWDGSVWSALGTGVNAEALTLTQLSDTLYLGGRFTLAGGVSANRIAAWDGSVWSALGTGTGNNVWSLTSVDDTLFVGGEFTRAGTVDDSGIAAWDGASWSSVGGGITASPTVPSVTALVSKGASVIAGGRFATMGPGPRDDSDIASFNTTSNTWSALGTGATSSANVSVRGLAYLDDTLFVGGSFTRAGDIDDTGIAAWDGTRWSSVGGGVSGSCGQGATTVVRAVEVDDDHALMYVGGNFCTAGGQPANLIAAWDDGIDEWIRFVGTDDSVGLQPVGNQRVNALAVDGASVYVGGNFLNAGGVSAADNLARWTWDVPRGTNTVSSAPGASISLQGSNFIGVPSTGGVYIGGVLAPAYVRDDSTSFSSVTIPSGVFGTVSIEVDAVGGRASVGTVTLPDRPEPAVPATAPRSVSAVAGDASAQVSWLPPASSGTFPISNYQVVSAPGGRVCLSSTLTCSVSGLMNGTAYTFTVRALTGAGWSVASAASNVVTPLAPSRPTLLITGSRDGRVITVAGTSTGLGMGAIVRPWVRVAGESGFTQGSARILVSVDGTFEWSRRAARGVAVYVATTDDEVRSNRVIIPAR